MTTQHPEALRLAAELDDGYPLTGDAISAAAELRTQHARITELESQLAQRFDAADMATAAAQGFRDGAAAKEQQAGAFQAALDIRTAQGWKLGGDKAPVLYTDEINGQQVCRDDVWLCTTEAFTHPYPPEGMAGWTTQPVAEQTKSADMSDEREAFEAWLRSIWSAGYGCPKFDSGKYVHHEAQRFWECWQASASHGQAPADAAPSAGAVAGPDDIDAIALTRYKVVRSHDSMFHRFAVVAGDGKQQLYLGRETECQNMTRKFAGAFLDGAFYQANITPSTQAAGSVPAVEREQERIAFKDAHRHLELYEVPDAWGRPMFKHSHVEASWLGWIARASRGQAPATEDSVQEDAARLDWLDQQCEGYGFQDIHEGNRWEISGPYANVRQAIDYERAARKQGVSHDR